MGVNIILALGFLSYIMQENGFPVAPLILGMIMGELIEENFMQAMIAADGNILAFFSRPIAATLGITTVFVWFYPLIRRGIAMLRHRTGWALGILETNQKNGSCST